jgi:hypothetical protein
MTQLTLTMIVRDEAEQLPEFLAHHAGLAEELVIVDTGSRDRTVEIARAAGAEIVHHTWGDDFAAARNAGLAVGRAPWILFLDADERIAREDFPRLRRALERPADCVYLQETWNYCTGNAHLEWQPLPGRYAARERGQSGLFMARRVGLFPRRDDVRFGGRVHESILPAAEQAGLAVVPLDVPVHHYGYTRSPEINAARQARYRRLVEMKHADAPDDPAALLELATVLIEDGMAAAALPYLSQLGDGPAGLRPVVRGLVLHGRLRREMGQTEAARKLLTKAVAQDPGFVFGWLERIRIETGCEDWTAAQSLLEAAERQFGREQPQLLREALLIKVKTKQLDAARAAATRLVEFCPQWQEIQDLKARLERLAPPPGKA